MKIKVYELSDPSRKELEEFLNQELESGNEIVSVLAYTSFWLKLVYTRVVVKVKE